MSPRSPFPSDVALGKEQLAAAWTWVSEDLKEALGESTFDLWFGHSRLIKVEDFHAVLSSPGAMYAIWIEENFREILKLNLQKYLTDLKGFSFDLNAAEEEADSSPGPVMLPLSDNAARDGEVAEPEALGRPKKRKRAKRPLTEDELIEKGKAAGLNETLTFETFVEGGNSRLAYAASHSVVDSPGTTYQPLFFHAKSGLGKTHLLHAIGWSFLRRRPHSKIVYVSSESYANEYIEAIRNSKEVEFRKKYRNVDLLLLDDVQFLGGKSGFQREFFHTFNSIMDQRNQIVIASDCLATEITQLEERLVSRLQWGMTVQIHAPDDETSQAILRQKRDDWSLKVNDEVIGKIVGRVSNNVRQLEGALIRAAMVTSLNNGSIDDMELDELLADMVAPEASKQLRLDDIKDVVADHYGVEVKDLESKRRMAKVSQARQVAMYLCRELTSSSLKEIAMSFAKDHASVVYAVKNTKKKCEDSESMKNTVESLRRRITRGGRGSQSSVSQSAKSFREEDRPDQSGDFRYPGL